MECIESIYQFSKDSKLQPPLFEVVEIEISLLSKHLQRNDIETVLFANAFVILSSKEIRIRAEGFQFSGGEMEISLENVRCRKLCTEML